MKARALAAVTAAAAVAALVSGCQSNASGNSSTSSGGSGGSGGSSVRQSCDVQFDPITIEPVYNDPKHRVVAGSAWATCKDSHLPLRHHMELTLWFQALANRNTENWTEVGSNSTDQIPKDSLTARHQAVTVIVSAACQKGVFQMRVTTAGSMPDTGQWAPYTQTSDSYTVGDDKKCEAK